MFDVLNEIKEATVSVVKMLPEKTAQLLGHAYPSGNDRVVVECSTCSEEVLREVSLLHKRHQCIVKSRHDLDSVPVVEFKVLSEGGKLPKRAKPTDAGYDIYSSETRVLEPGRLTPVGTGIAISAPDGWYYTIEGRSSLFKKHIFPVRAVIDASYTGETFVMLANFGQESVLVEAGDRVAQILMHKFYSFDVKEVLEFSPEYSKRGNNGFGSTGV